MCPPCDQGPTEEADDMGGMLALRLDICQDVLIASLTSKSLAPNYHQKYWIDIEYLPVKQKNSEWVPSTCRRKTRSVKN